MLRLSELKLPLDHGEEALQEAVLKRLRIPPDRLLGQTLVNAVLMRGVAIGFS